MPRPPHNHPVPRGLAPPRPPQIPLAPRPVGSPQGFAPRRVKPKPPKRPWIEFDPDGVFAFVNFLAMLFISSLGTIGAVIFTALAVAYGVLRFAQLREILMPRAVILVIPAFAIFSVLWSEAPTETLKYSIEFALTVGVGLLLSASPRPKAVLWGMFPAFAIYVIAALAFGGMVAMGDDGATAFSGLTDSKN